MGWALRLYRLVVIVVLVLAVSAMFGWLDGWAEFALDLIRVLSVY
jgi:hypothetical protein